MTPGRGPGSGSGADPNPDTEFPAACTAPEVIGDAVARERRTSGPALRAHPSGRRYSYRDFVTTSYKAGNVLRYLGVRPGDEVRVASERVPETVLTFFGAAQLGAVTRFGGPGEGGPPRVVVAPATREDDIDLPPGHHLVVYGDPPENPGVTHWETEVWSENPAIHPVAVEGADPVVAAADRRYTHREVLAAATEAASAVDIGSGTEVTVRGTLADPGVVAAGLVAPILAGGTMVFVDEGGVTDGPSVDVGGVGVDVGGISLDGAE